ncbi:Phage integrase family protein [Microbacterium hydrothermale]|uniref:tyrosine-type recombinase/integrase n=1 Tax=Microbacterium hydrothermale TaxID=857427 RepID=UPI00222686BF|nr:site-specific integrase [Microbacterium hydrothermale]MCW2165428.1 Phage integrase family protein [Microbacterium hydrothermale]
MTFLRNYPTRHRSEPGLAPPPPPLAPPVLPLNVVERVGGASDVSWFGPVLACGCREVGLPELDLALEALAGFRLGEAAGLQLGDVNFLGRSIQVRRQVQGSSLASTTVVAPKWGSERTVFVPGDLTTSLSAHVAAERLIEPDEHIFRTPTGHLFQRNNAGEAWRGVRERAGLPSSVTLHTLRHTYASNLIASGCDVVTVQRALGHSQPSITLNTYAHLWPSAEDKTRAATAGLMASIAALADSPRTQEKKPQVSALSYR